MGAVRWYCPRAKNEKRQKLQGLDVLAIFPTPPSAKVSIGDPRPLQGRRKGYIEFIRRALAALSKSEGRTMFALNFTNEVNFMAQLWKGRFKKELAFENEARYNMRC